MKYRITIISDDKGGPTGWRMETLDINGIRLADHGRSASVDEAFVQAKASQLTEALRRVNYAHMEIRELQSKNKRLEEALEKATKKPRAPRKPK